MIHAFVDEMEKIKRAGAMKNIGDGALGLGRAMVHNARNTLTGFATPLQSMKMGLKSTSGTFNKTLLGIGAAAGAPEAFSAEDPRGENRSRTERAASWAGEQAGGLIGSPHGFLTGPIVGSIVGKQIGKITGKIVHNGIGKTPMVSGQVSNQVYSASSE